MTLDTRARAASAAVHQTVSQLDPGEPRPPRPSRVFVMTTATAVIALLVGAFVLVSDRTDRDDVPVAAGGGDLPRLVPRVVPQGFTLAAVMDFPGDLSPEEQASTGQLRQWIYGAGPAEDPFAGGEFAVMVTETANAADKLPELGDGVEALDVNGKPGTFMAPPEGSGLPSTVGWVDRPDLAVNVASFSLDRETLVDIASGVVINGDEAEAVAREGFRLVAELDASGVMGGLTPSITSRARIAAYGGVAADAELPAASLSIAVGAGDHSHEIAMRWGAGPTARPVTVRGRDARLVVSSFDRGEGRHVTFVSATWVERPGVLAVVGGQGVSEGDVIATAESLEEVSEEEWQALKAQAKRDQEDSRQAASADEEVELTSGELASDSRTGRYRLVLKGETVCLEIENQSADADSPSSLGGANCRSAGSGGTDHLDVATNGGIVWGITQARATGFMIILANGRSMDPGVGNFSGGGFSIAWFLLDPRTPGLDAEPVEVIAYADDREIARAPVDS